MPVNAAGVAPQTTLLDFLRSEGLTGAKEGCAEGECGACAVLFVKQGIHGSTFVPVNSCLVPLPAAAGQEIYTVEALSASGRLAEAQQAMIDRGGSQCGYCTPGFVISMFAEQYRPDRRGPCDLHNIEGNLCRCTGYRPIRDAVLSLGPPEDHSFRRRLTIPPPRLEAFRYRDVAGSFSRPASVPECLELLGADTDARLVAGNTDLGVLTNLHGQRFSHLISLEAMDDLRTFRDGSDGIDIGAGLTLREIEERWLSAPDVIGEWLSLFASPLIRNRATLGGNLATASPIADSAPLLLALDASVSIAGLAGERSVRLQSFFQGYRQTLLGRAEILLSIHIPKPLPRYIRFYKVAKRRTDDISTVAACFSMNRDQQGRIRNARLSFGGVAAVSLRAIRAETLLEGAFGTRADLDEARNVLREEFTPIGDHRGSAAYRMAMAQNLLEKFWFELQGESVA